MFQTEDCGSRYLPRLTTRESKAVSEVILFEKEMSTYKGRVVLVTGASSGIGAAIAEDLVKAGLTVVGAARRVERIQELSQRLKNAAGRLIPRKLDVSKEGEIQETFEWIEQELGGVDVLINNAALLVYKPIHEHTVEELKYVTDVNHLAVVFASREALKGMIKRNVNDGYIININSILGHHVLYFGEMRAGTYSATKFAMTALCETLRQDIKHTGLKIRVTSISPGGVKTEMPPDQILKSEMADQLLSPEEVAQTVTFVLSLPKTSEVTELTIRHTGEVY